MVAPHGGDAARRPALAAAEQHPARRVGSGNWSDAGTDSSATPMTATSTCGRGRAGERVMASVERFLRERLRLKVNREKSAVDRPWNRKFLGYTVTPHRQPKLKVSPQSVSRLKERLRAMFRRGRGRSLRRVLEELRPVLVGWMSYFRKSQIRVTFEELDQWIRRKLRAISVAAVEADPGPVPAN